MQSRNARLGLRLFAAYLVLYAGFVGINTFSTETMDVKPFAGINLAIWYGFALILAAILLALIYGIMCDPNDSPAAGVQNASAATSSAAATDSPATDSPASDSPASGGSASDGSESDDQKGGQV